MQILGINPLLYLYCTYGELLDLLNNKKTNLQLQCDDSSQYHFNPGEYTPIYYTNIWAMEEGVLYTSRLYVADISPNNCTWDQTQNDIWRADFDGYRYASCNKNASKGGLANTFGAATVLNFNDAVNYGMIANCYSGKITGIISTLALTTVVVRGTTYTEPTSAAQRSIKSSSANDTAAGTGARTVRITYFDGSMNGPYSEVVTMNGTGVAATVATNIRFIEKLEIVTAGSNSANVGIISLYTNNSGGSGVIGSIAAGDSTTYWGHHYVASGKTCYINHVRVAGTVTAGSCYLRTTGNPISGTGVAVTKTATLSHAGGGTSEFSWSTPVAIIGPDLVIAYETPAAITASTVSATFDFIEIQN